MKIWIALAAIVFGLVVFSIAFNQRKPVTSNLVKESGAHNVVSETGRTPVVVELFTSEGCSSCPPADQVLSQLDKLQSVAGVEVIALAQHVDYWNRLGWTDPFSSPLFSARQGDYARAFGHDGVYTPQMIVDGQTEFPGGNKNRANEAIMSAARLPKATVKITRAENQDEERRNLLRLAVSVENLPVISSGDTAEVLLAITESNLSSNVSRGENSGRRLQHAGVVRNLSVIGSIAARAASSAFTAQPTVTLNRNFKLENVRAVVFVQERESRHVLGAASFKLAMK